MVSTREPVTYGDGKTKVLVFLGIILGTPVSFAPPILFRLETCEGGLKAWICGAPNYRAISTYYLVDKCDLHFLECAFFFYRKRAQRDLKSI